MKKLNHFVLLLLTVFTIQASVNAQCSGVIVAPFPLVPQSGNHNYFGIRATLVKSLPYTENVVVDGYIYEEGNEPNTDHPYEITITAGNMSAETSASFYETTPTGSATISVTSVTPCPPDYDEATIATYSTLSHTYTLGISPEDETVLSALADLFSDESVSIDSLKILDDDPSTLDSASYLVFYGSGSNGQFSFGFFLEKHSGTNQIIYSANNKAESIENSWKCGKGVTCSECLPHRNWFLGRVTGCYCGTEEPMDCVYIVHANGWDSFLIFLIGLIF